MWRVKYAVRAILAALLYTADYTVGKNADGIIQTNKFRFRPRWYSPFWLPLFPLALFLDSDTEYKISGDERNDTPVGALKFRFLFWVTVYNCIW